MESERGIQRSSRFSCMNVPVHFLRKVEHCSAIYKQLERAVTEPACRSGAKEDAAEAKATMERYAESLSRRSVKREPASED